MGAEAWHWGGAGYWSPPWCSVSVVWSHWGGHSGSSHMITGDWLSAGPLYSTVDLQLVCPTWRRFSRCDGGGGGYWWWRGGHRAQLSTAGQRKRPRLGSRLGAFCHLAALSWLDGSRPGHAKVRPWPGPGHTQKHFLSRLLSEHQGPAVSSSPVSSRVWNKTTIRLTLTVLTLTRTGQVSVPSLLSPHCCGPHYNQICGTGVTCVSVTEHTNITPPHYHTTLPHPPIATNTQHQNVSGACRHSEAATRTTRY